MIDKQTEQKARKQLPEPYDYPENYIDIKIHLKNGMYHIVTFAKTHKSGELVWIALPYAR